MPFDKTMTTLSPQKVIVSSVSMIPPSTTHVELILYDPQEFYDTHLTLPATLTNLILKNLNETVTQGQFEKIVTNKPFEIREPT
jgi:hypothetical protein